MVSSPAVSWCCHRSDFKVKIPIRPQREASEAFPAPLGGAFPAVFLASSAVCFSCAPVLRAVAVAVVSVAAVASSGLAQNRKNRKETEKSKQINRQIIKEPRQTQQRTAPSSQSLPGAASSLSPPPSVAAVAAAAAAPSGLARLSRREWSLSSGFARGVPKRLQQNSSLFKNPRKQRITRYLPTARLLDRCPPIPPS